MFKLCCIFLTTCLIYSLQRQNGSKDSLVEEPSLLSTNNVDGKPATKIVKTVQVSRFKVETWLLNWRWWMDFGLWKVRICLCVQGKELKLMWWSFLQDTWQCSLLAGKTKQWFYHQHHCSGVTDWGQGAWKTTKTKSLCKTERSAATFPKNEQKIAATKQASWSAL